MLIVVLTLVFAIAAVTLLGQWLRADLAASARRAPRTPAPIVGGGMAPERMRRLPRQGALRRAA